MPDLRPSIEAALGGFTGSSIREAGLHLLATLGYQSDKTIDIQGSKPQAFLALIEEFNPGAGFDPGKAQFPDWTSADILFQLTDEELSSQQTLFKALDVNPVLLRSYLFFAIELSGRHYARGKLTAIARQINRVFPMPVMVLIKHLADKTPVLSIAVINRRRNQRDAERDVLGKVTIIRDIDLASPHRGHLDILDSFALRNLVHPKKQPIQDFDSLHAAWEEIFNVELLNQRFYRELANWYFWALPQVEFPAGHDTDPAKRRATGLIRLLTRLIFCWFLKEKGLIPERLFHRGELDEILTDLDDDSSSYYYAILQNLFFATLNQRMGKRKDGSPHRTFARDQGFLKNRSTYGLDTLYRYEALFRDPDTALTLFEDIPFLNGGLFECLDRSEEGSDKKIYIDGFSRNAKKRPRIPNRLFFSPALKGIDLSDVYGDRKRRNETVSGLLPILNRYKFTIVENTPIDQEIALDPELLGKVFENLLASYNEETRTTPRKQTGSFYTPRPIVDYMVDESLKAHLAQALGAAGMAEADARAGLDLLFAYTEREHAFSAAEVECIINAIHACKVLDPACGSGAFPMGVLHKLVYILGKLDPGNERWKALQIDAAQAIPDSSARETAIQAIDRDFSDNELDYGRKLYLVENCLYGVDIQPIAIQISKLRFFISLVCDQKTNRDKAKNHGIRPLPNLETKFVAADTLIGLKKEVNLSLFANPKVEELERDLQRVRHEHFSVKTRRQKLALQNRDRAIREELVRALMQPAMNDQQADVDAGSRLNAQTSRMLADWDPYDPQSSAGFFEPLWMFDRSLTQGFDIVIQNPPYISHDKITNKETLRGYESYDPFADIYCYFIEKASDLLRSGGISCSITSNSFLRADYGAFLRNHIQKKADVRLLVSIGESQVFQNAIVNIAILLFSNGSMNGKEATYTACQDSWLDDDFDVHIASKSFESSQSTLGRRVWSLSTDKELGILQEIESCNLSLLDRNVKIRLGLATGSNSAFLVSREKCNRLIEEDDNNRILLKPVIRGRDVRRYRIDSINEYLILARNGVDLPRDYPILANHLESFGDRFRERGAKGEKWWNLRSCSFYDDFEKDRVVWIEMTNTPRFAVCPAGIYMLNTAYFLLPPKGWKAYTLVALLNSSVSSYYMKHTAQTSGMGVTRWFKTYISQIPIPNLSKTVGRNLFLLARLRTIGSKVSIQFLEDLIDACVMECYFHEHMAERDLLFHDDLAPQLADFDPEADEATQRTFLENLHRRLDAPESPIRNRLLRLTADSPDLLAVIKREGRV